MNESNPYIVYLFSQYLTNRHTEAELDELLAYFNFESEEAPQLLAMVQQVFEEEDITATSIHAIAITRVGEQVRQRLRTHIHSLPENKTTPSPKRRVYRYVISIAATLLLVCSIAWYFQNTWVPDSHTETTWHLEDATPTSSQATLEWADGRTLSLDKHKKGIIVGGDGLTYTDGSAVAAGVTPTLDSQKLVLRTPKGGTYQIVLSDGTKVWLNAASTLTYPSVFATGADRIVKLEGEAYFEVKKQAHKTPFHVQSKGQIVEVLGTHFNVSAYSDDTETQTTLVEGSVWVYPTGVSTVQTTFKPLQPGQQAVIRETSMTVRSVHTASFTDWKDGRFTFAGKTFDQIMRELGRWYDFEVDYEGPVPTDRFMGGAYRTDKIATALQFLESSRISYRLAKDQQGKRHLIIMNTK